VQFDSPDDGPAGPKHVEKIVRRKLQIYQENKKVYQAGKVTKYSQMMHGQPSIKTFSHFKPPCVTIFHSYCSFLIRIQASYKVFWHSHVP